MRHLSLQLAMQYGLLVVLVSSRAPGRIYVQSRASDANTTAPANSQPAAASQPAPKPLTWLSTIAEGVAQAQPANRPILVRLGADWCTWCRKLDAEIARPAAARELARWTLVYIDIDRPKAAEDVSSLGVGPIPALRVLTPAGRLVASQDGFMPADALVTWLNQQHGQAASAPAAELVSTSPPTPADLANLIKQCANRDATIREAVIRRLTPYPAQSAKAVVEAFADDRLIVRLTAIELLALWNAPVQEMDPWRPETLTQQRLQTLKTWAAGSNLAPTSRPAALTADDLAGARRTIANLVRATSTTEAQAARERLARLGPPLLPEVYAQLKTAEEDLTRERLTGLRYRLVCSDDLALRWPSGFDRLASMDAQTRQRAAEELSRLATGADGPLLVELFSSPDSMVREISLRTLHGLGGPQATEAIVKLLADPEPNVRAAVLKQLAEKPSRTLTPKIAAYLPTETDPDLVVHAVRALRAAKSQAAVDCLMTVLNHPSWQVRAEAAEAVGECVREIQGMSDEKKADAYVSLLKLLDDPDGFVVSRAVEGLKDADLVSAVEPLAKVAAKHPQLAAQVTTMLAESGSLRLKAIPYLRGFCSHAEPVVRAAAIAGLCMAAPTEIETELRNAVVDRDSRVRIAAANGVFSILENQVKAEQEKAVRIARTYYSSASPGAFEKVMGGLFGRKSSSVTTSRPVATMASQSAPASQPEPAPSPRIPPKWMASLIAPLEKMLDAPQADERAAACRPLIALGRDEKALPILLAHARTSEAAYRRAADILPWLPWEKRQAFLDQLLALQPADRSVDSLMRAMAEAPDERATGPLWDLLARPGANAERGQAALQALTSLYYGPEAHDLSSMPSGKRRAVVAAVKDKVTSGPPIRRTVALILLLSASPDDAAEACTAIFKDPATPSDLRADAFQILLLSQTPRNAESLAVANLVHPQVEVRRLALIHLSMGSSALMMLHDHIWLYNYANAALRQTVYYSGDTKINLQPPKQITPEMLRPMLKDSDARSAACAGYLLSLFGEADGLAPLIAYWRTKAQNDDAWQRLVYRAIAAINDDNQVATLEEIYGRFQKEDYSIREFYWTIRVMTGPKILKLRERIRSEVGMQRLR